MSLRAGDELMLLLLAGPALAVTQQPPAFSGFVEAVRVDVLVTDKGQTVRGLQPADFEVLDNGVRQQVDLVSFEEIPLNVVLVERTWWSKPDPGTWQVPDCGRRSLPPKSEGPTCLLTSALGVLLPAATYSPTQFPVQYHRR